MFKFLTLATLSLHIKTHRLSTTSATRFSISALQCAFNRVECITVASRLYNSLLRFFTLVDTSQPSGENRNNTNFRSPLQRGTGGRSHGRQGERDQEEPQDPLRVAYHHLNGQFFYAASRCSVGDCHTDWWLNCVQISHACNSVPPYQDTPPLHHLSNKVLHLGSSMCF